jgi:hypothetical protein
MDEGLRYERPDQHVTSFTCPHCGTLAQFEDDGDFMSRLVMDPRAPREVKRGACRRCRACRESVVFVNGAMVYPRRGLAPPASEDMPDEVRALYEEAATISADSPRAASALLRVAIEALVCSLSDEAQLNAAIGDLVRRELISQKVQRALDVVRVNGNDVLHPGQIDDDDSSESATALFRLVNMIVESGISEPQQLEELYAAIPEGKRQQIARRDGVEAPPAEDV